MLKNIYESQRCAKNPRGTGRSYYRTELLYITLWLIKKINMKKAVGSGKIKNNEFLDLMDAYQACLFNVFFVFD